MALSGLVVLCWCVLAAPVVKSTFVFPTHDDLMPGVRTVHRQEDPFRLHFPMVEDNASLDLPEHLDELDIENLPLLNNISSIEEFAHLFGLVLPQPDASDPPPFARPTGDGLGLRFGGIETEPAELANMANCKPELRTVELELPDEPQATFYPTCVRLEQCGGCCFGPLLTCTPTKSEVVRLQVLKSSRAQSGVTRGSSRRGGNRRRREQSVSYHTVEVVKHLACECGCRVKATDCNDTIHAYHQAECACVCKDRDEKRKCQEQNSTKYWSDETCSCYCRRPETCGTGEFFNQVTCKCEALSVRIGGPSIGTGEEFRHSSPWNYPTWRPRRRKPVREW